MHLLHDHEYSKQSQGLGLQKRYALRCMRLHMQYLLCLCNKLARADPVFSPKLCFFHQIILHAAEQPHMAEAGCTDWLSYPRLKLDAICNPNTPPGVQRSKIPWQANSSTYTATPSTMLSCCPSAAGLPMQVEYVEADSALHELPCSLQASSP